MVSAVEKQLVIATFVSHRINRFMYFNLPVLSLGGLLGVGDLASTPVLNELRHPAGTPQVTVA